MRGRGRSTSAPLVLAWLPLALLLGERTVAPPVQGRPLAESEFRGAEEAWTTTGAATPAVYTPQGFQSARLGAKGQGKVWFFVAPPPFLGDKLGAYHGVLEFRLGHATHTGAELPRDKLWGVLLEGKGITIATATRVGLNSLLLTEDGGWTVTRGVGGGHAPTQGQLLALFSDITALKIRGHFYKTSEMTWISSVRLLAGDEDLGKLRARIPKTLTAQPLAEVNKVGVGMVLSQRVSGFSSQLQPSGLKWLVAGVRQPVAGSVLTSTTLAAALMRKMGKQDWDTYREHGTSNIEFTQQEWKAFGIADLRSDHFIQSGAFYFQPVQRQTYEQTFERRPASKPESLTDLFVRPRQQDLESTKPRTQSPSIADVRDLDIEMQHSHHVPSQKTITDSESLRESPNPRQGLDKKEEVPSQVSAADAHREANHFMKQSQPAVENAVAADEHQISDAVIRRDGIGFARRWRLARSGIGKRDESNFSQSNRNVKSEL